ncbi:hypothetical protein HK097_002280 [Rhizophlyctis rosea]|uniref:NAD(P)-binding protein n=1 Tax=Rhizophlyctis rosea TaxID=64517 RepID=A0AAD5SGI3_9FUNG|nr:hypothetical protein HK097_002280 [Rhizophlyctis rosea]
MSDEPYTFATFVTMQNEVLPTMPHNDLTGKTIIVTGSNTGIGYEVAKAIATMKPAKLILAARNEEKTLKALQNIQAETGFKSLEFMQLDLASFDSVRAFAAKYKESGYSLDVLINNAGVNMPEWIVTKDGYETAVQTNHLSTTFLTILLTPILAKSSNPRIVLVSSEVHYMLEPPIRAAISTTPTPIKTANDPSFYPSDEHMPGMENYKITKLFNVLTAQELSRRLPNIFSCSVNPGLTVSELRQTERGAEMKKLSFAGVESRPTVEGAKAIVYCAVVEKPGSNGGFYTNVREEKPAVITQGEKGKEFAGRLWRESVEIYKGLGVELEDWVLA